MDTRWGSQVALFKSVLSNRLCVEQSLLELRRSGFSSTAFNTLDWIWLPAPWKEAEELLVVLEPLAIYITKVEGDQVTQGEAVELYLPVLVHLTAAVENLWKPLSARLKPVLNSRSELVFSDYGLLANLLDYRFRGTQLNSVQRRKVIALLLVLSGGRLEHDALLKELEDFCSSSGRYSQLTIGSHGGFPAQKYWTGLFSDAPLAAVGSRVCGLPAASASVERLWSAAGYQVEGGEGRLLVEYLC